MKTFKILFAALIFVGFATSAMAQQEHEITASAEVVAEIVIGTETRDLDFGVVGQNTTVDMNPSTGDTENAGLGSEFGAISLSAQAGQSLAISWVSENLEIDDREGEDPNDEMSFTPEVSQLEGATSLIDHGGESFSEGDLTSASGNVVFYIGGELQVKENQNNGSYTGSFELTVEYN